MLYLLPLGIMCILCLNNKFVEQNYNTFSIVMIVHVEYNGDNTFSIVQAFLRCCTLEQSLLCYTGQVGPSYICIYHSHCKIIAIMCRDVFQIFSHNDHCLETVLYAII